MAVYRNRQFQWSALLASTLFLTLLGYRSILWNAGLMGGARPDISRGITLDAGDSWMNIFQNGKKIGFSHRRLDRSGDGYRIDEETVMNINTMGMVQKIHVRSISSTNMDFAVERFDFSIVSGSFDFSVMGEIQDNVLYLRGDPLASQSGKSMEVPLENRPYLTSGIVQAVVASGLKTGEELILFVFDPSTLGQAPAEIRVEGEETITLEEEPVKTRKVLLKFKGARQYAWIDEAGNVIKEQGMLGITLVKTDRAGALDGVPMESSEDLTLLASIPSNKTIQTPEALDRLKVKFHRLEVEGDDGKAVLPLNQGRQRWNGEVLIIEKESLDKIVAAQPSIRDTGSRYRVQDGTKEDAESLGKEKREIVDTENALKGIDERFKKPDPFIQSDHPRIQNVLDQVVKPDDAPLDKVKKLVAWIQENIRRQPVLSLPNALSTLENRVGDCNEHAALMAAFCRAAGIPAKIEAGLVYMKGRFYYHAWNAVYLGKWVTVDALFNQIPADVTHIAFSSGAQELQLDLVGVIGRVEIEIID